MPVKNSQAVTTALSPGQKAALTRKRRLAGFKAALKRKRMTALLRARAAESASKKALRIFLSMRGWRVVFFEGVTGAPRTGIIDAVAFRLRRAESDVLEVRLIQLKGGGSGIGAREIGRLKQAAMKTNVRW